MTSVTLNNNNNDCLFVSVSGLSLAAVAINHAAAATIAAIAAAATAVVLLFIASTSRTKRCVLHTNGLTRLKIRSLSYEIVKTCVYIQ